MNHSVRRQDELAALRHRVEREVTHRSNAEREAAHLRAVYEALPDAIVTFSAVRDQRGTLVGVEERYANARARTGGRV